MSQSTIHEMTNNLGIPDSVIESRHPATQHFVEVFAFDHLIGEKRKVSQEYAKLAAFTILAIDDGPELSAALRSLASAKDCAVRAYAMMERQREIEFERTLSDTI